MAELGTDGRANARRRDGAAVVNERLPWKRLGRSAILLPWIVPTVLSTMAWLWLLTPNFSVINWILVGRG